MFTTTNLRETPTVQPYGSVLGYPLPKRKLPVQVQCIH